MQFWLNIGKEEQLTVAILVRNDGVITCIDAKLRVQGITRVHIHMVSPSPTESRTLHYLQTREIHGAFAPELQVFAWEIAAHHRYQVDLAIERGSRCKIRSSPSQDFLSPGKGGLDGVESDRTNNQNGHSSILPFKYYSHT